MVILSDSAQKFRKMRIIALAVVFALLLAQSTAGRNCFRWCALFAGIIMYLSRELNLEDRVLLRKKMDSFELIGFITPCWVVCNRDYAKKIQ